MLRCAPILCLVVLAACFKIEHRTEGFTTPATSQLMGEWLGTWGESASGLPDTTGALRLTVQTFLGLPVLRLDSDNPCLLPQEYTLSMVERHLELRGTGDAVFLADFGSDLRSLNGSYSCNAGSGSWSASWVRELGPLADLTGHWLGTFNATNPVRVNGVLSLDLRQEWVNGLLRVSGRLSSPSLPQDLVIQSGMVNFDESTFRLSLFTDQSVAPFAMLGGDGDAETMVINEGQIVLGIPPGMLLGSGTWRAIWTGP